MKRRNFASIAGALASATLASAAVAKTLPDVRWRLASSWPKNLDTIYGAAEQVSRRVGEATGGAFKISVHAPGELMPAFGVVDGVQQESVECAHTSAVFFFGKNPAFALDGQIPFGMTSRQMTAWMRDGGGSALLRDFYSNYKIINFPCGNTGAQMGGFFKKEIRGIDDFKGLKFRVGGFGGEIMQRMGAVPLSIPGGEIYPALEKGVIDAAEFVGPYDDEKLGLHKVAPNYYFPSFLEGGGQISMYVGERAWNALPLEYRTIFELACAEAHVDMQAKYDSRNPAALKRLVGAGVKLKQFPKSVVERAHQVSVEAYQELSSKNESWRKIFASYDKFHRDSMLWSRFSDGAYENSIANLMQPR